MELFTELFTVFDSIAILIATAVGAFWFAVRSFIGRFGLAILTGLGRGAGTGIGARFTGSQAGAQMSSRRMPSNPTGRHARHALWNAEARQLRMKSYVDAWCDLLATRGGPFALSIHLQSLLHDGFREKVVRLRRRCREFDRLEAVAQRRIQFYERDYARQCEPIRDEILALTTTLARWKARHRRFAWRFWKRRWRYLKRRQIAVRRELTSAKWRLYQAEWRLNTAYRATIEPALVAVDQYERNYLMHWVHSFEADLESFRLTVMTGRLLDLLFAPSAKGMREHLGLGDLPDDRIELRDHVRAYLTSRKVAFSPLARLESLFESYLRMRLLDDPQLCERWHVNPIWLEYGLPAPGAIGLTHERFGHLTQRGDWRLRDVDNRTMAGLETLA